MIARSSAALVALGFLATAMSLRADSACFGDCSQTHAANSAMQNVDADSPFDIYFEPDMPLLFIAPSSFADESGPMTFLLKDNWREIPLGSWSGGDPTNSPTRWDPAAGDPAAAPEPRYSALFVLGIGWAGLTVFRMIRSRRDSLSA